MERHPGVVDEAAEELDRQVDVKAAHPGARERHVEFQARTAREIDHHARQALVQRHVAMAVAGDALLVADGALIKVRDMEEACEIANAIAPEHLEISAENPRQWSEKIRHAGAIFLGRYTSESLGDYCAGPNHVLPTSRTARFSSPLGVYDFQKRSSLIEVSEGGAQMLGQIAAELAYGEGLQAHARSAEYRFKR